VSTLHTLRESFLRLIDTDDTEAVEAMEAQAAMHFKELVDGGKVQWCGLPFPPLPGTVDGAIDPRINRQHWVGMWGTIYREISSRNPGKLPDRFIVAEHRPAKARGRKPPMMMVTTHKVNPRLRLEGNAALCDMLDAKPPKWSTPMQKSLIAKLLNVSEKQLTKLITAGVYRVEKLTNKAHRIDLNTVPEDVRADFSPAK